MTEFEGIYRRYYAQMYRLAKTILYEPQESKDVVSDIFARLLRDGRLPQKEKMEGYLMTAVRNRCRDVISHKSIRERVEKLFLQESLQNRIVSPYDDDRLDRLMQFIETEIPPLSRQIFRLRFLREMSYEEVAQTVGVSKVTVYNHLSQSLQRIREHFDEVKKTAKRS
jgi:RNA polymerase sigma-70 factor (ECF subfamily)